MELADIQAAITLIDQKVSNIDRLNAALQSHGPHYQAARPFPHTYIDNFFDADILNAVLAEFPKPGDQVWHQFNDPNQVKLASQSYYQAGPVTRAVINRLNSPLFLSFLQQLTGIQGLIPDPYCYGGGLHQIINGGRLEVHSDFNKYPQLGLYRRLNLLVYLNNDWRPEWGGQLELWNKDLSEMVQCYEPLFNRMVVFSTGPHSWHGHPRPLNVPQGVSRKSLALYYYTVDYPYPEDMQPRTTDFRQPARAHG